MRERPILFNGAMVRAILAGRKTQTRRAVKMPPGFDFIGGRGDDRDDPSNWGAEDDDAGWWWALADGDGVDQVLPCPYGQPGDRLWVRETWGIFDQGFDTAEEAGFTVYRADEQRPEPKRWRPSIHMPRSECRLVLEITTVRVERLHGIWEAECIAEGAAGGPGSIPGYPYSATPREHFEHIWTSTGGNWNANPFVWVIGFRVAGGSANG